MSLLTIWFLHKRIYCRMDVGHLQHFRRSSGSSRFQPLFGCDDPELPLEPIAIAITAALALLNIIGTKSSANFNNILVVVKS